MTSLLLIVSFLIHLVLFVVVYQLYQQIQELKSAKSRDTEMLLSRFLDEIKQENRQLQQQLQRQSKHDMIDRAMPQKATFSGRVIRNQSSTGVNSMKDDVGVDFPPLQTTQRDKVETSVESKIFQMYRSGMPTDQIAKQLNRGKTEVELLVKLAENRT